MSRMNASNCEALQALRIFRRECPEYSSPQLFFAMSCVQTATGEHSVGTSFPILHAQFHRRDEPTRAGESAFNLLSMPQL